MNWRDIVDQKERERRAQERQQRVVEYEAKTKLEAEIIRRVEEDRLRLLSAFHCHICGVISKKPKVTWIPGGDEPGYYGMSFTTWSQPGDLQKCSICGEWTCEEHIYKGICQKCAEKL